MTDPGSSRGSVPGAVLGMSVKEWMLERFARWLDEAFGAEVEPQGLAAEILDEMQREESNAAAPEAPPDLFALWSSMTALSQEVKLQGRSVKEVSGAVSVLPRLDSRLEESGRAHSAALDVALAAAEEARAVRGDAAQEAVRVARRSGQRELLDVLLDVRDRLLRGLDSARRASGPRSEGPAEGAGASFLSALATPGRWLAWLKARGAPESTTGESVQALENGYRLGIERMAEALERLGVREFDSLGQPFDPHRMNAVEVEDVTDRRSDGTVLEVHRPGYAWGTEVLRPAQVKVARLRVARATLGS